MEAKELLDSLDVGVAAMAPDWTIAEWSAAAARIIAVPPERVLGQSIWTAFPAAKGTELERVFGEVFADGKPRTFLAPAGAPESPGTLLETRVTRGPGDHLTLAFRPVHEQLAPESRAARAAGARVAGRAAPERARGRAAAVSAAFQLIAHARLSAHAGRSDPRYEP